MKRMLVGTLAAAAISTLTTMPAVAQSDQQRPREERMAHWAADREMILQSRLAGMKTGLGLTADQEKLWTPLQAAILDAFQSRMETMQQMVKMREGGGHMSPSDRMEFMASRMAQGAAHMKATSEAMKPLYASLDAKQKHNFDVLSRSVMMSGRASRSVEWVDYGGDAGGSWEPEGWDGQQEQP
ncbi:LTXXQ motif family protein [Roseiarcus fermentans]|uniref:LTXXQ motif family protein n=1 Tax=Roseiarcus fermentans TaxID=1473586 RepID=A0A366FIG1_9HYPH|nr:Spy/CpxP family protein refolding chaperone [Roseiarcus fermentans]RBP14371.1 LTXXQ motif family protein [Roseiarcus fermentans]